VTHPFKAACGLIKAGGQKGTGYLVAPDRVATCWHVVKEIPEGDRCTISFDGPPLEATVLRTDKPADAAILTLTAPLSGVTPLPLAGSCKWKAAWDGYGYPGVAGEAGVPIEGIVTDPDGLDDRKLPAIVLRSPEVAAGMATPVHGFSGSPVLVDGAVIGHLKRVIQDPGQPGRPAFGLLWATPSREVLKLLGVEPARPVIDSRPPPAPAETLAPVGKGEYHVFVSYRSTDRAWATALVNRLEGAGFRVFMAERELVPGDLVPAALQSALARSQAAVIVVSRGWLESRWCQEESSALLERAVSDPSFRAVPLRIDDSEVPSLWASRLWLDFRGTAGPEGPEFERLQYALAKQQLPAAGAAPNRVLHAETEATDDLVREVRAAAAADPQRVFELWKRWHDAGLPDGPAALLAAQSLIERARPDLALTVLGAAREGVRATQLRALALAKTGKIDDAIELLAGLREAGQLDAETGGLLAGRYKQKWLSGGNRAFLQSAHDVYEETFARTADSYPGINAAALALQLGRPDDAQRLARQVLESLASVPESELDHWKLATVAEANLILGDVPKAAAYYGKAVARVPTAVENIAGMRRGARSDLRALGLAENTLDATLPVPRIAAFTGHMVDAPGRAVPRFPQTKVGAVRRAIRERLLALDIGFGFSSAARGGDLLFLEELLKRGGRARVFLPFPRGDFAATSVGQDWAERYGQVMDDDRVEIQLLSEQLPPEAEQPAAFLACNLAVHREAIAFAKLLDEEPVLIAVWNGSPGDGVGGTADAVRAWDEEGYKVEVIDIAKS